MAVAPPVSGVKVCTCCREQKPLAEFHRNPQAPDGRHPRCRDCKNAAARAATYNPLAQKRAMIKYRYGLGFDDYLKLVADGCRICGADSDICVDHDHKTGEVRGALCRQCNKGIGNFKDNPALLSRAIEYLRESAT